MCVCARAHLQNRWMEEATRGGGHFLEAPFQHSHHSGFPHREGRVTEA